MLNSISYSVAVVIYINYEEQKELQIVDLGSPGAGTGHVQTIVPGKSRMIYNYFV